MRRLDVISAVCCQHVRSFLAPTLVGGTYESLYRLTSADSALALLLPSREDFPLGTTVLKDGGSRYRKANDRGQGEFWLGDSADLGLDLNF